jgi:hypothetical protein
MLEVDGQFLGYDLHGKNKSVLVRDGRGQDIQDLRWKLEREVVRKQEERVLVKRFQVVNGALKGWWIGLGPLEPAKGDRRPRACLILVKDKKDAAGFRWTNPEDEK